MEEISRRSQERDCRGRGSSCPRSDHASAEKPSAGWWTGSTTAKTGRGGRCLGRDRGARDTYVYRWRCSIYASVSPSANLVPGGRVLCASQSQSQSPTLLSPFLGPLALASDTAPTVLSDNLGVGSMDPLSPSNINPSWSTSPPRSSQSRSTPTRCTHASSSSSSSQFIPPSQPASSPFREPKIFGAPGLGLANPPNDDVTQGSTSQSPMRERQAGGGGYLRVRIGALERNRKDLLIRFDANVSLILFPRLGCVLGREAREEGGADTDID